MPDPVRPGAATAPANIRQRFGPRHTRFNHDFSTMRIHCLVFLMLAATAAAADDPCKNKATPECQAEQAARCRRAIAVGMDIAHKLPVDGASEARRKQELVDKLEALVAENRRNGVDECRTWGQFSRIAAQQ
jgi:hypothetical protein